VLQKTKKRVLRGTHAKADIQERILARGWTFQHLLLRCEFCKKSIEYGAKDGHTRWHLVDSIYGYYRGVYGLEHDNYEIVSTAQVKPEHVVKWSVEALRARKENPKARLIIEHGTPQAAFAKVIYRLYLDNRLTAEVFDGLLAKHYRIAVITVAENQKLNGAELRSTMLETAEARWAAVGIQFP
jgi:hypothetical protein